MTDYYLRCLAADIPALMGLAGSLGVLRANPDHPGTFVAADPANVWCPIGPLYKPTGKTITTGEDSYPEMAAVCDADGKPYWHANLRYDGDLMAKAQATYAANPTPQLAAALANLARFFVVDPVTGRAAAPAAPAVVFA